MATTLPTFRAETARDRSEPGMLAGRASTPAAFSVDPSGDFDGNDGSWSTFAFRVGSPPQVVKLLIATSGQETWVVHPQGCTKHDPQTCPDDRGYIFDATESDTWELNDFYGLDDESNLGYHGNGEFGFDLVAPGWDGEVTMDHQIVAGIATKDFYLGQFGVTSRPTNFTDFIDPQPSFLTSMKDGGVIPSLSYGYTAGASYRPRGMQGSLTLGGYDAARFTPNKISFSMNPVTYRDLLVGVQSISMSSGDSTQTGVYAMIDGGTPHIWLPIDACRVFEKAFGITFDEKSELYLVNDTQHAKLLEQDLSVSFQLGNDATAGPAVSITLPYASFDLQATEAYVGLPNPSRYFPLRRAESEDQYTLGRTFLQEAYLIVDYERGGFSVSQATFNLNAQQRLIDITSPVANVVDGSVGGVGRPSTPVRPVTPQSSDGLPVGAIAGIAVGGALLLVLAAVAWYLRRLVKSKRVAKTDDEERPDRLFKAELDGAERPEKPELHADFLKVEISGAPVHEAPGAAAVNEVAGKAVSEAGGTPLTPRGELDAKTGLRRPVEMGAHELAPRELDAKQRSADAGSSPIYELPGGHWHINV